MPRAMAPYRDDVLRVGSRITKLARAATAGSLEATYNTDLSYKELDAAFQSPPNEDDIQAMLAALPPDDGMAYVAVAGHQRELLQHAFPRAASQELTGTIVLEPDPIDWYRFIGLYDVVNDPFKVFELMANGALLQNQAAAVRIVYPTLSQAFDTAISDALVEKAGKELPYAADIGIRDWLGLETKYKPYQAAFIEPPEQEQMGPGPSDASVSPESKASLSAAQSALYGNVGR